MRTQAIVSGIGHHKYWPIFIVVVVLLPIWITGIFDRGLWTPDEPREADIAWRMSQQADRSLPRLANNLFLEKPPLSYWVAAGTLRVFGNSVVSVRAANFVYAATTVLAIAMLVYAMAGVRAACVAAIVAGSAFTSYQVAIWLAPDACLTSGCAIALLGLYRGYTATAGRDKLAWYTLMHVGALIGFMAKSGPGWLVPGLTFMLLVAWEKRWNELLRWQLWLGFGLQLFCIGLWIAAVAQHPNGGVALRVLFWNNLMGRFVDVHASGALNYTSAHKNWPGKYFVELPYYLFPWALLVVAALHRAWTAVRDPGNTSWRFAIAASVPFLILLSLSATGRDIYVAPVILGLSVAVGLWSANLNSEVTRGNEFAVRGTRYLVMAFAVAVVIALLLVSSVDYDAYSIARRAIAISVGVVLSVAAFKASALRQHNKNLYQSVLCTALAFAITLTFGSAILFPVIDRWQDLSVIARQVKRDSVGYDLALLQPDETTIAMLDYPLAVPATIIDTPASSEPQLAQAWFADHPVTGLLLVKLPGHAPGGLSLLLNKLTRHAKVDDGMASVLENAAIGHIVARYELPHGRRYALLNSAQAERLRQYMMGNSANRPLATNGDAIARNANQHPPAALD
jgi:4-amino-4-deoxy-L-arabinose transferase-like glycosyltransferase